VGYRWEASSVLSIDATVFHSDLKRIHGNIQEQPFVDSEGRVIIPIAYEDTTSGHATGGEVFVTYAPRSNWDLSLGDSLFQIAVEKTASGPEVDAVATPRHQLQLRSSLRLPRALEVDGAAYYVDRIPGSDTPSYVRFDAQLSWSPARAWGFSVVGQNLSRSRHIELSGLSTLGATAPVARSVYAKITWRH
jgi:TonB dependent receptor